MFLNIFTSSIETFFEKVAEGKIEVYLTKPVSIWVSCSLDGVNPLIS
ncbi:hypothetical protein [Bartonella silvatica]